MVHDRHGSPVTSVLPVTCASPLRWAGGKRRLLPLLRAVLPRRIERVIEPFFGGGSVSLGLAAEAALGADTNEELVNFFVQATTHTEAVLRVMAGFPDDRDTYSRVRDWQPDVGIDRAGRFAYLNRTGYFGLYRTNRHGKYNVPYGGGGRLNHVKFSEALHGMATVMSRVTLEHANYLSLLSQVEANDVVFLDPPYGTAGDFPFRRYGSLLFSSADHRRLATEASRCRELGARVFLTLPSDDLLLGAYEGWDVVGERRRGGKTVELCLSSEPPLAPLNHLPGEWSLVRRVQVAADAQLAVRTGTQ